MLRFLSGLRVQVALIILVVTACLYSLLSVLGFLQIAHSGHDAVVQRVEVVVAALESQLLGGVHTVHLTTPDGVTAWVISPLSPRIASATNEIIVVKMIKVGGVRYSLEGMASEVPLSENLHGLYDTVWIGVPFAALLSALLAGFAASRVLRPVGAITRQVELIGPADTATRVPQSSSGDEIDHLAATVNSMLDRIAASRLAQRQFTSDAAHELRTPLMALQGELELAQSHAVIVDDAFLIRTSELTSRLTSRVDDLVLLSKLDEAPPLRFSATRVDELVAREAALMPRAIDVTGGDGCVAEIDQELIERAVRNLLSNACRHARSLVEASVSCDSGSVEIFVDDDGVGIDPSMHDAVFDRFRRLDDARSADAGGAGLGLAIASSIVGAHGGELRHTVSPLGGARLVLSLPAKQTVR